MKFLCLCFAILLALLSANAAVAQTTNVTVLWDPSPEAALVPIRYKLVWAPNSLGYTNPAVAASNSITSTTNGAVMTGVQFGTVYYIAVAAQDTNGLTSVYSEELAFVYPRPGKKIRIAVRVQQSEDLIEWVDGPAFAVLDVSDRYRFFRATMAAEQ